MSDNQPNRTSLEMLELVAAVRAVLTVAKAIQDRMPDATVEDIAIAVDGAISMRLAKLKIKGVSKLTAVQFQAYKALSDAAQVIPQVQAILLQARDRTAEEIEVFSDGRRVKLEKAKLSREKSAKAKAAKKKAATADEDEMEDMFADE